MQAVRQQRSAGRKNLDLTADSWLLTAGSWFSAFSCWLLTS